MRVFFVGSALFLICLPFMASPQAARLVYQYWYYLVLVGFVALGVHNLRSVGFWILVATAIFDMSRAKGWIDFVAPLSPWGAIAFLGAWFGQIWMGLLAEKSKVLLERKRLQHDIRSPLLVLNTISKQLAKKDPFASEILRESKQRLESLILNKNKQDTVSLVQAVEKFVTEKQTEFSVRVPHIRIQVASDPGIGHSTLQLKEWHELSRHLSNLLNNAVEATEAKAQDTGLKQVSLTVSSDSKDQLSFEVVDSGEGFTSEQISRFKRSDIQTTKASGQGIGLSAARNYAQSKRGRLMIRNETFGASVKMTLARTTVLADP
jgi:signal transduction histidine kinase